VQISRECTPAYLSSGISNLLQPAQAEVVLGQLSRYLASWDKNTSIEPGDHTIQRNFKSKTLGTTDYYIIITVQKA
jgi:hypothetical protein